MISGPSIASFPRIAGATSPACRAWRSPPPPIPPRAPTSSNVSACENARVFASQLRPPEHFLHHRPARQGQGTAARLPRRARGESGIVYCLSRKKVEQTADWLNEQGIRALPYHAGMDASARSRNQDAFINEDGVVMVATVAFGMGIDKPDVRFVAHLDMPGSIEAYYQETGRAGRDGDPSAAWMCYAMSDVVLRRRMIDEGDAPEEVKRIERSKLNALLNICETTPCRRQAILSWFGETASGQLRKLRQLPLARRNVGRNRRRHQGDVRHLSHRRAFRRHAHRRRADRQGHREGRTSRPRQAAGVRQGRRYRRQDMAVASCARSQPPALSLSMANMAVCASREEARPVLRGEQKIMLRRDQPKTHASRASARAASPTCRRARRRCSSAARGARQPRQGAGRAALCRLPRHHAARDGRSQAPARLTRWRASRASARPSSTAMASSSSK